MDIPQYVQITTLDIKMTFLDMELLGMLHCGLTEGENWAQFD